MLKSNSNLRQVNAFAQFLLTYLLEQTPDITKLKSLMSFNKDIIYKFYKESKVISIVDVAVILYAFKKSGIKASICEFIEVVTSNLFAKKNFELIELFRVIL